ncbi:hypothetical protein BJ742DRAFT_784730 [Cladochytrium replicatum]|nr:hypothetical protein BJ742DRAFT_784730 [Cladochytrium replicatum]
MAKQRHLSVSTGSKESERAVYCYCKSDGQDGELMIECEGPKCTRHWFHGRCLPEPLMTQDDADRYERFFCPECEPKCGPCIMRPPKRKSARERAHIDYNKLNIGKGVDEYKYTKILKARTFLPANFARIRGSELTIDYARRTGLESPVIIEDPEGLDMKMPDSSITVRDVAELCGEKRKVDVIEVSSQAELVMTLEEWATYYEQPPHSRKRILNVISLEFSDTALGKQVVRPKFVRDVDWIDNVWPAEMKARKEYPKVQLYCLMSVKDSYTDFHIDFGGSSVFYHIIKGEKIFYFMPPTPKNLKKFEKWSSSPDQSQRFLGDETDECYEVKLCSGNTMIIPSGWIHSVYTPKDSLVIGGNFLQGYAMATQLDVFKIEDKTLVPLKFRFPHFESMQWWAAKSYYQLLRAQLSSDKMPSDQNLPCDAEMAGLDALISFLSVRANKLANFEDCTKDERKKVRRSIPRGIKNAQLLVLSLEAYVARARAAVEVTRRTLVLQQSSENLSEALDTKTEDRSRSSNERVKSEALSEASQSNDGTEDKREREDMSDHDNEPPSNGNSQWKRPREEHVLLEDWESDLTDLEFYDTDSDRSGNDDDAMSEEEAEEEDVADDNFIPTERDYESAVSLPVKRAMSEAGSDASRDTPEPTGPLGGYLHKPLRIVNFKDGDSSRKRSRPDQRKSGGQSTGSTVSKGPMGGSVNPQSSTAANSLSQGRGTIADVIAGGALVPPGTIVGVDLLSNSRSKRKKESIYDKIEKTLKKKR